MVQSVDPKTKARSYAIETVDFKTYVQNVLPNEWAASWDGDAVRAGAVAVKSYAWYWVDHFGGYLHSDPKQCFDVTDDQLFQVYRAGSSTTRTNTIIDQTWPVVARKNGDVFQASYQRTLTGNTAEACGAGANDQVLSQYGSQNCVDTDTSATGNTGNKYNVILQLYYGSDLQLTTTAQLRSQHDFQFLHQSTPAVFSSGRWTIDDGYPTTFDFGRSGDIPAVNTTGDGFAHIGYFRPSSGVWYFGGPTGVPTSTMTFGRPTDQPVQAQYKGLASATQIAIYRPSTGVWYFAKPAGGIESSTQYGRSGDVPVPGRWTSSTADGVAVYRPSDGTWHVRGGTTITYGRRGDIPAPADYDGNGTTDIAVYRPSTREFYVRGHDPVHWGLAGDIPVTGDFNGDGKADLAVYRPSNHTLYVRGGETLELSAAGTPIGAAPYHD
ncbi:SpoIID/LytB domain-containing protein [uncultured Jatrophihabitans sp.]|uniref:SpoIID/LytB domain-containing protein n=1 Tax=uncultured Jatrophihabitans sp. TaxID=1610747 RepID=UPI0035C98142